MAKILKFERRPSTLRIDSTKPNQANIPTDEVGLTPTEIAKSIRAGLTDNELEDIKAELESEADEQV